MSNVNEREILGAYKNLFMWLLIISLLINTITLFVPIFHQSFSLGGHVLAAESEMGIKYLGMDFTNDVADRYESAYGNYYDEYYQSNSRPIRTQKQSFKDLWDVDSEFLDNTGKDTFVWKLIIRIIIFLMMIGIFCSFLVIVQKNQFAIKFDTPVLKIKTFKEYLGFNFWLNTIYTVLSIGLCWILINDWELEGVMTLTFIPWIFQLAAYIACRMLSKHQSRALKGEVEPIKLSFASFTRAAGTSGAATKGNTEDDKVELLIKYKELLDNGVISEEEYNAKKKELL